MCGIVGYLNLNGAPLDPSHRTIDSMCRVIEHRGPDEKGMTVTGPVALGMTRLSIIDLATGQQPILNEDKTIWIVFNGEIYNFQELQPQLRKKGHKLATNSDTEVIVHLYEEYGVDCLQYLEGMFAFALWDQNKQRLFLARDRMGEKPLHWAIFDGQFVFGSEIKGLLDHPAAKRELNPVALRQYLALEYVPAPETMFQGIHKLKPAHYMIVENGQVSIKNYWRPEIAPSPIGEDEAVERFLHLLHRTVKLTMISDVPLGVFLSGGIDSSGVAAVAAQHSPQPLKTFSIGFADPSYDETQYARMVANHIGADHSVVEFSPHLALSTMEELLNYIDEPLADASILPTFFLSKMTKRNVTVALSGDGGDELFGGYPTYQAHQLAAVWMKLPQFLRHGVLNPLINSLPVSLNNLSFDFKARRFISAAEETPFVRHLRWMGSIPLHQHRYLLHQEIIESAAQISGQNDGDTAYSTELNRPEELRMLSHLDYFANPSNQDVADAMMRLDLSSYLPEDLLVKSDRASMAASLEVRIPFLSYPMVEFALSLPSSLKVRGSLTKYLPKKALAPLLPAKILQRQKKGFGIPVAKWINADFRVMADELLNEGYLVKQGIFNQSYITKLLLEHRGGVADRRKELWTLIMFQRWWQKFLGSNMSTQRTTSTSPINLLPS
jgi:asparagine synthase (glutamine-hydrolysing)